MSPGGALTGMTALFTLPAAAASGTGLVRKDNEDAAYAGRWLFTVADGHAAGEVASAPVIDSVRSHDAWVTPETTLQVLAQAVAGPRGSPATFCGPGAANGNHADRDALVGRSRRVRLRR